MPSLTICKKVTTLLTLFLLCFSVAAEQEPDPSSTLKPLSLLVSDTWNTRDGLPHNSVNRIVQSESGYLWFATWDGPVRFNGHSFYLYEGEETSALPDQGLYVLHEGPDGTIYAGGRGFVAYYKGAGWEIFEPVELFVYDLKTDNEGNLWIATAESGVIKQRPDQSREFIGTEQGLPSDIIYWLHIDEQSATIWFLTDSGVVKYNSETRELSSPKGLPEEQFRTILQHSNGDIYIAGNPGLFRLASNESVFQEVYSSIEGQITALVEGTSGEIWFGTMANGLGRIYNDTYETMSVSLGLPNPHVLDIFIDHEENIWVSTHGGLLQLRDAVFSNYTTHLGLPGNYIRALTETSDGDIWIGTSQGPAVVVGDQAHIPGQGTTLEHQSVLSLHEHVNGEMFVGSYTSGLFRFHENQIVSVLNNESGLHSNEIRSIISEDDDRIWVGTSSGVYLVDISEPQMRVVERFTSDDGFISSFITVLKKDSDGTIWVGSTNGAGRIYLQEDGSYSAEGIVLNELAGVNNFFAIEETRDHLWFSADQGLVAYSKITGEWELLSTQDGMPFPKYFTLSIDERLDQVWLGASRGLVVMRFRQILNYLDTGTGSLDYELYTEADGMRSAQVNTGGPSSLITNDDQFAWFAMADGAVRVGLNNLGEVERLQPPILLERVLADGEEVNALSELKPGTTRIQFTYTSLGFRASDRIEYQVRLVGFDESWHFRSGENSIEYTRLPPGKYEFQAQARYPGGPWSEPVSFSFAQEPLLWQRHEFWIGIIIFVMILVNIFIRLRENNLKNRERKLKREVANKTAELERLAREDSLTRLSNRRAFDEMLRREFRKAVHKDQPVCLAILDIDHFKQINDTYLHSTGDRMLSHLADVLKGAIRKSDYLARWGGEEFVVFLPGTELSEAMDLCERIRQQVENATFDEISPDLSLTVSIGVAQARDSDSHSNLLIRADKALYKAKEEGRNCVRTT